MCSGIRKERYQSCSIISSFHSVMILIPCLLFFVTGCVSERVKIQGIVPPYQETLVGRGPQERTGTEALDPIRPLPDPALPGLMETKDDTGRSTIDLTLEDAVARALVNSPELTSVSFDPSIAKDDLAIAASEFDIIAFGEVDYNKNDKLSNDISLSTESHSSSYEAGIKQKGTTGAEWRFAYSLTRSVDESISRRFKTAYEPVMTFELRQPLLRDAWFDINLADVNISKINYQISLADFRQKAEDIASEVISLYWRLLQARRDVDIQQAMLDMTIDTLRQVETRKKIDATMGDIKQAEASVKNREATLFEIKKVHADVQDQLVRFLADHQMNLIDDLNIVPISSPDMNHTDFDQSELLKLALKNNPNVNRAKLKVEAADINVRVAKKQMMPRLDFFGATEVSGLSDAQGEAQEQISGRDYVNYSIGLALEYPLGNREKKATFHRRKLQHGKAVSNLQSITDQVAALVKKRVRSVETAHENIQIWKEAVNAASIHLKSLDDILRVRKKLTPEYLLTKIQAQESLAKAQRSEVKAIVDYNIALVRLDQAVGTVLDIRAVKKALPVNASIDTKIDYCCDGGKTDKHASERLTKEESPEVTVISTKVK